MNDNCPALRIIVTSSRSLGVPKVKNFRTDPFILQRLESNDSAKLFLENCDQSIDWKEIRELILMDDNFAYNECLYSVRDQTPPIAVTEELREELTNLVRQSAKWTFLLSKHDMFVNLLLGNPTSIILLASAH